MDYLHCSHVTKMWKCHQKNILVIYQACHFNGWQKSLFPDTRAHLIMKGRDFTFDGSFLWLLCAWNRMTHTFCHSKLYWKFEISHSLMPLKHENKSKAVYNDFKVVWNAPAKEKIKSKEAKPLLNEKNEISSDEKASFKIFNSHYFIYHDRPNHRNGPC